MTLQKTYPGNTIRSHSAKARRRVGIVALLATAKDIQAPLWRYCRCIVARQRACLRRLAGHGRFMASSCMATGSILAMQRRTAHV